jgi:multidrug resistance protein
VLQRSERAALPAGFSVIWVTVAVDLIGFGIVIPLLPQYATSFGASATTIGLLVASFSLAQLVMAPIMGRISDRVGRRPVLLVSLFGTALGSLITGLAGSVAVLFLGRILDGASGASVSVAQASAADLAGPRDRARLMGLLGAAFGVGFVAGPAIGALGALRGPHVPFYIAAAISFVNALVALRRLPETHPDLATDAAAREGEDVAAAPSLDGPGLVEPAHLAVPNEAAERSVRMFVALAFLAMLAFSAFEATFALLGAARLDFSLATTGVTFAAIGVVLVGVQAAAIAPVTDRLGERDTLRLALACNAAGFVVLSVDLGWAGLVPALLLLVVGQGLLTPTLSAAVAGRAGAHRGRWLGWQQSAGGLARVVGPAAGGALFDHVSLGAPSLAAAAIAVLALALVPSR